MASTNNSQLTTVATGSFTNVLWSLPNEIVDIIFDHYFRYYAGRGRLITPAAYRWAIDKLNQVEDEMGQRGEARLHSVYKIVFNDLGHVRKYKFRMTQDTNIRGIVHFSGAKNCDSCMVAGRLWWFDRMLAIHCKDDVLNFLAVSQLDIKRPKEFKLLEEEKGFIITNEDGKSLVAQQPWLKEYQKFGDIRLEGHLGILGILFQ